MAIAQTLPITGEGRRPRAELLAFFALAFLITWGLGVALIFFRPRLEALTGPVGALNHHWLYYLAVSAPTLSALLCAIAFDGWAGVRALGARFLRPLNPVWIVVAITIWPLTLAVYELALRAMGAGGAIDLHALAVTAPTLALFTPALLTDPGGFGEETGWRGYALPRLLEIMRPATAAVVLGLIWGLWHLPAFFLSDLAQSRFGLGWFLGGSVAISVLMTWLYRWANGNVVVAGIIPHLMSNLLFDAHVFRAQAIVHEAIAGGVLAVVLIGVFGFRLRRGAVAAE